jgi:putative toxin-antitoxin system antitoxin component (TIGR02293 family)
MTEPNPRTGPSRQRLPWSSLHASARAYYLASPLERIEIIRHRVPATYIETVARSTKIPKERLYRTLGLARATMDRKVRDREQLTPGESERIMAIVRLVGQADNLVRESGDIANFDAATWVAAWLNEPHPALGGRSPGDLMDTEDGRALVSNLLAQQQSGAYA